MTPRAPILALFIILCARTEGFSLTPRLHRPSAQRGSLLPAANGGAVVRPLQLGARHCSPSMGLFGLGWPEIAVLGVVGLFLFGPEKLAPLAKDFGAHCRFLLPVSPRWAYLSEFFVRKVSIGPQGSCWLFRRRPAWRSGRCGIPQDCQVRRDSYR